MKSFEELYCERHRCDSARFAQDVFFQCLHRRALVCVTVLGGYRSNYFSADRELVAGAGRATHMKQVREEVRDYMMSSDNRGALRRVWKVRLSARRMLALASKFLPGADVVPPPEKKPIPGVNIPPLRYEYSPRG